MITASFIVRDAVFCDSRAVLLRLHIILLKAPNQALTLFTLILFD